MDFKEKNIFGINAIKPSEFLITREDEASFPSFTSLKEARSYFRERYGELYNKGYSERIDDETICYFDEVNSQPVQILIYNDGGVFVHIVY